MPLIARRAALLGALAPLAAPARGQGRYPDRPIRVFVPWTPGGATDIQMRSVCDLAGRRLGQPVVVENRPGASGTLGAVALKDAKPDGYTLSQMPGGVFRMPAMQRQPQWDPLRDFTWIIRLVGYMGGVVVRPDAPWQTMTELVEHARQQPGRVNYGTPGANTTEVQMQRLARAAGIEWVPVAFRGAAPNLQALLSGDIHFSAETSAWADMALEGRVRPLAVWMSDRVARFPAVPTFRELGWNVLGESTYGIAGPRGLDPAIVQVIHDAFRAAVHDPAHAAVLARFDMPVRYLGPDDFATDAVAQMEEARRIVRELGLTQGVSRLHLRCGDDLRDALPRAGLDGDYLGFADPVCQGPARDDGDLMAFLGMRARFVALHAGQGLAEVRLRLGRDYMAVAGLRRYDAVWLWFEHDLWDQAVLLRVLSLVAETRQLRGRLHLLPADGVRSFPDLADAELAALTPVPLTDLQIEQAAEAWAAYAAPDPTALDALARQPLALPFLGAALRRHLRDLPWTTDGLAETERQVLQATAAGAATEAAMLDALLQRDPVFQVTDLIVADIIRRLRVGPRRLLLGEDPLRLSPAGVAVLAGAARHRPVPREHAGVTVRPDPPWLWDPAVAAVVPGAPDRASDR